MSSLALDATHDRGCTTQDYQGCRSIPDPQIEKKKLLEQQVASFFHYYFDLGAQDTQPKPPSSNLRLAFYYRFKSVVFLMPLVLFLFTSRFAPKSIERRPNAADLCLAVGFSPDLLGEEQPHIRTKEALRDSRKETTALTQIRATLALACGLSISGVACFRPRLGVGASKPS